MRIAVARLESMPATPTFASSAVAAAKTAESSAQTSQLIWLPALERGLLEIDVLHSPRSMPARICAGVRPFFVCW